MYKSIGGERAFPCTIQCFTLYLTVGIFLTIVFCPWLASLLTLKSTSWAALHLVTWRKRRSGELPSPLLSSVSFFLGYADKVDQKQPGTWQQVWCCLFMLCVSSRYLLSSISFFFKSALFYLLLSNYLAQTITNPIRLPIARPNFSAFPES